jgi:hypothetical protein
MPSPTTWPIVTPAAFLTLPTVSIFDFESAVLHVHAFSFPVWEHIGVAKDPADK